MIYARCKNCRSEIIKIKDKSWEHVYSRASQGCNCEPEEGSEKDVEK
jgi:hypothetical protein